MSPINLTASSSAETVSSAPGVNIFSFISGIFGGGDTSSSFFNSDLFEILNVIWLIYVLIAFSLSILMLALYAYASTRRWQYYALADKELREAESQYDELYRGVRKNDRLDDVLKHLDSINPNDWKLAIIEADIILDDLLKQQGIAGNSLGERLKSISPNQLNSLSDAWEAHKIRNRIAHDGADFILTQRLAQETINRYRRVFTDLGL